MFAPKSCFVVVVVVVVLSVCLFVFTRSKDTFPSPFLSPQNGWTAGILRHQSHVPYECCTDLEWDLTGPSGTNRHCLKSLIETALDFTSLMSIHLILFCFHSIQDQNVYEHYDLRIVTTFGLALVERLVSLWRSKP